jgi:hypothetical protein
MPEAEGAEEFSPGFQPHKRQDNARRFDGRMVVPEGQHDSSQARSAWNHQENSPSQRDDC